MMFTVNDGVFSYKETSVHFEVQYSSLGSPICLHTPFQYVSVYRYLCNFLLSTFIRGTSYYSFYLRWSTMAHVCHVMVLRRSQSNLATAKEPY